MSSNRDVRIIAEKIDYHFPNLSVLESVNDEAFTAFVFRDVRRIKKMRRDMARLGGNISTCSRVMSFTGKVVLMHEFLASLRIDHGGK